MFDHKSDYALNKIDKEAIVYPSVTGIHTRLTCEDFASEAEYSFWKTFSDCDYKDTEDAGRSYYDHCVSLTEARKSTGQSAEDIFFAPIMDAEQRKLRISLLKRVKDVLTKKQYRRLWMLYVEGKKVHQIAKLEGVSFQAIYACLCKAKREIVNKL